MARISRKKIRNGNYRLLGGRLMELWDIYDKYRQQTGRAHERGIPSINNNTHKLILTITWIKYI